MEKVVFVLPSIKTGGGNRVIIELSNELIFKGVLVDIVYPNNSLDLNTFNCSEKINFVKIGTYKSSKINKLRNLFITFSFLSKNYSNSIFIFTDPIMSIFTPLVKNNIIYRFIQADDYSIFDDLMILKNNFFLLIYKFLTKLSYGYKIDFLFNSKYTFSKFLNTSKRNDVDYNLIHPSVDKEVFFNQNIRKENEINICIVARKHPLKGFIDFIKPFNEGKIHGINNVYIVSHDDLGDFDLSNVVLVKPKNDKEIAYYMNISHIFTSTSWWEGFGLPSLEAMSCGCSVILTNAGGVNEYAIPNQNCLMYEPKNQEELVLKLNLLIKERELQKKLSHNALDSVESFSWKKSTNQLLEILNATN